MKTFRAEYDVNYVSSSFGYALYAVTDHPRDLGQIYASGYLPYTGDLTLTGQVFYLARSLRVRLDEFSDSSENRRVDRKASELGIEPIVRPVAELDLADSQFLSFCQRYAEERFTGGAMPLDRLNYILGGTLLTHIIEFRAASKTYGYVFAVLDDDFLHYWFSFFDTAYMRSHSLGKWIMWRTIRLASDLGLSYAYLGTCYGSKGLYKARDHKCVAFFDGTDWNCDLAVLKTLAHRDDESVQCSADLFKSRHLPEIATLFAPHI